MTAKEMFEELGFNKFEETWCRYEYENNKYQRVCFHKDDETVTYCRYDPFSLSGGSEILGIDSRLLKAITKQFEDLGWLNE